VIGKHLAHVVDSFPHLVHGVRSNKHSQGFSGVGIFLQARSLCPGLLYVHFYARRLNGVNVCGLWAIVSMYTRSILMGRSSSYQCARVISETTWYIIPNLTYWCLVYCNTTGSTVASCEIYLNIRSHTPARRASRIGYQRDASPCSYTLAIMAATWYT